MKTNYLIFSVAILEQFSLQYLISSLCLANQIKKEKPNIKIIFFGNCPEEHTKKIMDNFDFIDAFPNDGNEYSVLDYINNHQKKKPIKGILYRIDNKLISTDKKRKLNINNFPTPDFSMFNLEKYKSNNKLVLPYELSRGCINNCFFCYYIHKNKKIVKKDTSKAINDIKILSETYNTNYFHFMDAEINFDESYLKKLCGKFIKKLPDIKWSALAITNMKDKILKKLKMAGCIQLRWGVEYGSERMLKIINKRTSKKTIIDSLKFSHKLGINNYITLISGLNNETKKDITETIDFIKKISPYTNSAKECVFGELGHFSLHQLDSLFNNNNQKIKLQQEKYNKILKKENINTKDIIKFMTENKNPKISFIITPFSNSIAETIPSTEIFNSISYVNNNNNINYYDFQAIFNKNKKTMEYIKEIKENKKKKIYPFIKLIYKFIKKNEYYIFYIHWWNNNLKTSLILSKILKHKFPKSKILFFGPFCKLYHKELLNKYSFIDGIFINEIEKTIKRISKNQNFFKLPNIAYKFNKISQNKILLPDLNKLNNIDYSKYFDFLKKYNLKNPPFLYYKLSRGCIYNCFFCSCLTAKNLRYKKINFAINEIKNIITKNNIQNFYFLDDAINFSNNYLLKFLDKITNLNLKWSTYAIPKDVNLSLLKKLKKAGCIHIRWGIESANPEMQKKISKNLDLNEVSKILDYSHDVGICNQVSFIVGLPHECISDFDLIIKFINKHKKVLDCINIYKFKPRRGSSAFKCPSKFGINIIDSLDKGIKDDVPFDEIGGLNWNMKKEQQKFAFNKLKLIISNLNIPDIDPHEIFLKILKGIYR